MIASKANAYMTAVRVQTTNLLTVLNQLHLLRQEWDALDYISTYDDAELSGDNEGKTKAQLAAVLGTSLDALDALLAAGHATNLFNLKL